MCIFIFMLLILFKKWKCHLTDTSKFFIFIKTLSNMGTNYLTTICIVFNSNLLFWVVFKSLFKVGRLWWIRWCWILTEDDCKVFHLMIQEGLNLLWCCGILGHHSLCILGVLPLLFKSCEWFHLHILIFQNTHVFESS